MWLYKNGDQLLCQTCDGVLHKMNIIMNTKFNIKKSKNNSIEFTMLNSQREYKFTNRDAKYIDYDLVDRVLHSVPVDT